jgi:hypothetical protein
VSWIRQAIDFTQGHSKTPIQKIEHFPNVLPLILSGGYKEFGSLPITDCTSTINTTALQFLSVTPSVLVLSGWRPHAEEGSCPGSIKGTSVLPLQPQD